MNPLNPPVLDAVDYRLRPFEAKDAELIGEASVDPLIPLITLITSVPSNGTDKEMLDFIDRQHYRLVERSRYSLAIAEASSDRTLG